MNAPALDAAAVATAMLLAAALITAAGVLWRPIRKWQTFTDLITRELTGHEDVATGERHPSLRQEIRDLSERLGTVEQQTRQLRPNGGTHLYDAIRRIEEKAESTADRVARLEGAVEALKPKPRTRKPKPPANE